MSQENVEAFKRAYQAGTRFDSEALVAELDPEVEWHAKLPALLGGEGAAVYRGHEEVRELFRDFEDAFGESHMEFDEIRDLGDRVLALGRWRTAGRVSGAQAESPIAYLVELRNGRALRVWTYLDHAEALEAVGLRE